MGTGMDDDFPVVMANSEAQTEVTLENHVRLEDLIEMPHVTEKAGVIVEKEALEKIAAYEEMAKQKELTAKHLKELSEQIGLQAAVVEKVQRMGEANATRRMRKALGRTVDGMQEPLEWLNYSVLWIQK